MAVAALPQWASQDNRAAASAYDANVKIWPATKNGAYDLNQRTGWATVTKSLSAGPEAQVGNTVTCEYGETFWFIPTNQSVTVPSFIDTILSTTNNGYTWG